MSKQISPAAPDETRIENLLAKIQPLPSEGFHQKMKQAAWHFHEEKPASPKYLKLKIAIVLTMLMLVTSLFVTPQGRAWAQEVFHFFSRINSLTAELPKSYLKWLQDTNHTYDVPLVPVFIPTVSPEMAALPGCETAQKAQSYACQVALAESKLGFDLKELPKTPQGWRFDSLSFNTDSKSAALGYLLDFRYNSYGTLYLTQGEGTSPGSYQDAPWSLVPEDKLEKVKVGNQDGEYVKGTFVISAGRGILVWDESDGHRRLAWSEGPKWYLLEFWPNPNRPDSMVRDQLIELAESLVESSSETTASLDPEYLYSISDAETLSGLDLKVPTLLPMGVSFSYAQYIADNQEVRLFYGLNDELVIHQWKGKSIDFNTRPKDYDPNSTYEIVKINGRTAFYGSVEGPEPRHFLWWEENGTSFQMYFYQYFGKIDQDEMIAMAESMQDINDFRVKEPKPYEYVSIYAEALGFEALEFPETPAGWSFANVWGDPDGHCISTIYMSAAEPGYLSIHQCATNKFFAVADIPASMAQQVKIGNHNGVYSEGSFITQDNGKLAWNPDLSLKQLYWQENGLWFNMTLSGETAVSYDKEDLVSYAESLR